MAADGAAERGDREGLAPARTAGVKPCTILVVESEDCWREMLVFLMRAAGYEAVGAADAGTAVRRYGEARPDLIIIDQALHGSTGLHVCSELGKCDPVCVPPIILLSDDVARSTTPAASAAGVVEILEKPPRLPYLMESVRLRLPQSSLVKPARPRRPWNLWRAR